MYTQEDLPKQVVRTLNQGSNVMSLDFHPVQQTILLGTCSKCLPLVVSTITLVKSVHYIYSFLVYAVGTIVGDIAIWEVGSRERIAHKTFKVWDISSCTLPLQVTSVFICLVFFSGKSCVVSCSDVLMFNLHCSMRRLH
jgi:WD40 repeat protein